MFSTTISIRGFQKFLTSHYVSGVAIACELSKPSRANDQGICEGHCVIAYVYIGEDCLERASMLTKRRN